MTFKWTWRETIKHQFFDTLALVGLRDRLRCPRCKAVGTWKPHGGWIDLFNEWRTDFAATLRPGVFHSTDRRWVCKYCGFVHDHEGEKQSYPNAAKWVWTVKDEHSLPTPKEQVTEGVWPWHG
jgi:rubredoxin